MSEERSVEEEWVGAEVGKQAGITADAAPAVRSRYKSEFFDWGEALVVSLTTIILLFTFIVRLIGVSGNSMFPTLHDNDKLFISNLFYTPQKGDIVVLTKTSFIDEPIVKRVIATAGDKIDIDFQTGEVSVNGKVLDEPYINEKTHLQYDMTFPQTVPQGCVFVMGDNRNKSSDSRISTLGMVDERYILGHVLARVLPVNRIGAISS